MTARFPSVVLCVALLALAGGCRNNDLDGQCDLFIQNHSRCDIIVFVDGWEAAHLPASTSRTVDDIGDGRHVLEAKDQDGRLIERRSIDIDRGEDYYWRIAGC
jgi:hypothetical protein